MDILYKLLPIGLLGIVFFVLGLLITRHPRSTKNEKNLFGYGACGIYTLFVAESITKIFQSSLKTIVPLYIFATYYFLRFIISLILIARTYNSSNEK